MENTNGSTIPDAVETCSSVFVCGGGGVSVVCSDVDRCEFRYEVRWTLEVKLGDSQPNRIERWLSWCGGDRCPEISRLPGP